MPSRSAWQRAPAATRAALTQAWDAGVPPTASALYARWWQLETWLRSLVFVEQSALKGREWPDILTQAAEVRGHQDRSHPYMASPDAQAGLAYLDVSPLFDLLLADWDRYAYALIDRPAWEGRVRELRRIRNRIGHCRRPHSDDLARLEQTLRDLEGGTFEAVASYNRTEVPDHQLHDPLVDAWIRRSHQGARRLVAHAERQYETFLRLGFSRRPWSEPYEEGENISGRAGYLWHVRFICRGGRPVDLRSLWEDSYLDLAREQMIFLTAVHPYDLSVAFPAINDPDLLADTIEWLFDAVLMNQQYVMRPDPCTEAEKWTELHRDLDARVQVSTMWSIVDDTTKPIVLFGA